MILLDSYNKIIESTLRDAFESEQPETINVTAADFDGVTYTIVTPDKTRPNEIVVSMHMGCYPELQRYGADDMLRKEYDSLLHSVGSGGDSSADVVLKIDSKALPEDKESVVKKVAHLKRNALAAPFERAFNAQIAGESSELMTVNYRDEEIFFVQAQADRVTVIFSTTFKDETDRIFGKVFLQEFVDARRQPSIQNAPQVLYSPREPPLELRGVAGLRDSENIAYVTFVLFPRHFATEELRRDAISRIQMFRDYLHYHIKCSKAYMHSRMRARVDSFLKVLNRAKPEKPDDQKEKKTASGRTFKMR